MPSPRKNFRIDSTNSLNIKNSLSSANNIDTNSYKIKNSESNFNPNSINNPLPSNQASLTMEASPPSVQSDDINNLNFKGNPLFNDLLNEDIQGSGEYSSDSKKPSPSPLRFSINNSNLNAIGLDLDDTEELDDEQTTDMFEGWRFELAGHLSDQPDLLQKMMSFMGRIEDENRELRKEKAAQIGRVNDLLRDASDTLCKQVNDFLAEKGIQGGLDGLQQNGSQGSESGSTIPQASSGSESQNQNNQNGTPNSSNSIFGSWKLINMCFLSCVAFTICFLTQVAVCVTDIAIKGVDLCENQGPLSDGFRNVLGLPTIGDLCCAPVRKGLNFENTSWSNNVTVSGAADHYESNQNKSYDKSKNQEQQYRKNSETGANGGDESLSLSHCPPPIAPSSEIESLRRKRAINHNGVEITSANCFDVAAEKIDELHAYKQQYHKMMKEYQRALKAYQGSEKNLDMLRSYVTRRGPIMEDPMGCWGGTFTPEICCSPWYGPTGHPGCWDSVVTFEGCCQLYQTTDTISRHGGYAVNALPEPGSSSSSNTAGGGGDK